MKRLMFGIVAFATCTMLASCGAKKNVALQQPQYPPYPNYAGQYPPQYPQQYPPQQGYAQYPQQQMPPQPVAQPQQAPQPQVVADPRYTQEIVKSRIQKLAQETNTKEIRAFAAAEDPSDADAYNYAQQLGRGRLAEAIESYVKTGFDRYRDKTKVNENYSIDDKTREIVQTAAKNAGLEGGVVLDSRTLYDPKTGMYKVEVCMKYDRASILAAMEAQSERILKNRAQFEKDMQEAWDEIDRNHGRIPIREEQEIRKNEREQQNKDNANQRQVNVMDAQTRHDVGVISAANGKSIYYVAINGQQQGPFAYEQLQAMVKNGQINRETKVWRDGLATWVFAGSLQELSGLFTARSSGVVPPPLY